MRHATCAVCGGQYSTNQPSQRFCSKPCRNRRERGDPRKQERERGRIRPARTCPVCGKQYHPTCHDQKTCGRRCADAQRFRRPPQDRKPQAKRVPSYRIWFPNCAVCGRLFTARGPAWKFCSAGCRAKEYAAHRISILAPADTIYLAGRQEAARRNHRYRARYEGIEAEDIDPQRVYERDRWTCKLCGKRVRKQPRWKRDPLMASLDHIIPISQGGTHVYSNVQCVHLRCNYKKHDRGLARGEQLMLIG